VIRQREHFDGTKGYPLPFENFTRENLYYPLGICYPVRYCRVWYIRRLFEKYPQCINDSSNAYGSPINNAVLRGDLPIVKLLLDMGADINSNAHCWHFGDSYFPLLTATTLNHVSIYKFLLERDANIHNCTEPTRECFVHRGAFYGQMSVVQDMGSILMRNQGNSFTFRCQRGSSGYNHRRTLL
jgi:hypothetical protein